MELLGESVPALLLSYARILRWFNNMRKLLCSKVLGLLTKCHKSAGSTLDKTDFTGSAESTQNAGWARTGASCDASSSRVESAIATDLNRHQHAVVLYTRNECHLCEQAEALLRAHRVSFVAIDIDRPVETAAGLSYPDRDRFDTCVPVLEVRGKIRFRGRIDPLLLSRIIQAELTER